MYNIKYRTVINALPVVQYDVDQVKRKRGTSRPRKTEEIMNVRARIGSIFLGHDAPDAQ